MDSQRMERECWMQPGGVRDDDAGSADDGRTAITELYRRPCSRCTNAGMGVPGAGRYYTPTAAEGFGRVAALVRDKSGQWPVISGQLVISGQWSVIRWSDTIRRKLLSTSW